ncbi:MAG: glutamate-cysteine ligase family protein [bacterium]|nr:glutamate-cysteine ligase family protein [bacterium]
MAKEFTDFSGRLLGTAGFEGEYLLIDPATGELVQRAADVLAECFRYGGLEGAISPEYSADMIEVKTGPTGTTVGEFRRDVLGKIALLIRAAKECGCALLPTAHHLNPNGVVRQIFEDHPGGRFPNNGSRYRALTARYPALGRGAASNTAAQFHIGFPMRRSAQRDVAVVVADCATTLGNIKVAAAANSPNFKTGSDYIECMRHILWSQMARSGPYLYGTWGALVEYANRLQESGDISLKTELWHVERFNKETLESRGMDEQPDMEHLFGLWAFVHALHLTIWNKVRYGSFVPKLPRLEEILERSDEVFRIGLSAPTKVPVWSIFDGRWTTLDQIFERLIAFVRPTAEDYDLHEDLNRFAAYVSEGQNGAAMLVQWHREEKSNVLAVYKRAARHFADSVEEYAGRIAA